MRDAKPGALWMPVPTMLTLPMRSSVIDLAGADLTRDLLARSVMARVRSPLLDGERQVCQALGGGVLDDDVDGDVRCGQRLEDVGGDARAVRHASQRDLRDVQVVGDAAHAVELLHVDASVDQGAGRFGEAGRDVDRDVVDGGRSRPSASCMILAPLAGQLQHLFVGDLFELARVGLDARVGGVDAVDVGVALAARAAARRRGRRRSGRRRRGPGS